MIRARVGLNGVIYDDRPVSVHQAKQLHTCRGQVLSIFWCGFGGNYCGQSKGDDVYPRATHVILAFGNTRADGTIDTDEFPHELIKKVGSGRKYSRVNQKRTVAQGRQKSAHLCWRSERPLASNFR